MSTRVLNAGAPAMSQAADGVDVGYVLRPICRVKETPMRPLLTSFKNFAFSGSLIDLAVGLAIGAAFAAVVESLGDVILPLVAAIIGAPNFDALVLTVNGSRIRYGAFLTAFVSFLLLTFTIMLLVQAVRRATERP
jgi:large conductance mechanosensitive channel